MMAFESIGISITTAKSTLEALYILEQREFVAIISDMGRQEGEREGYALLQEVRAREIAVPFFIYSSSDRPEHLKEAKDRGANATNNPLILYKMVVESLWS
ncbi:MAG: response regulator [Alphaproteobacteria bacterium]|nr:MAG: response regulator [Alphaproteobacteria bacterium]